MFQALRLIKARYDAAATTDENRRHWLHADELSANAANSPDVRRLLRVRSRYEAANNSYARGLMLNVTGDTVGTGPAAADADSQQRSQPPDRAGVRRLGSHGPPRRKTPHTAGWHASRDGEAFAILTNNPLLRSPDQT